MSLTIYYMIYIAILFLRRFNTSCNFKEYNIMSIEIILLIVFFFLSVLIMLFYNVKTSNNNYVNVIVTVKLIFIPLLKRVGSLLDIFKICLSPV